MCFYNCMENMERFTPFYAIAYAILNSMENLGFDKEDYLHVLVFYGLFYKRNRKRFPPCSHTLQKHFLRARVLTSIFRSPKLPLVFL